jgi:RNA polymerase sigma factor (TIGR02999 family)
MAGELKAQVTAILAEVAERPPRRGAFPQAPEELLLLVYPELRRLARSYLRRERRGHTLQTTALVHEAYERLVDQSRVSWQGRTHFKAVAAQVMRRVLIDHARKRARLKRGGDWQRVTLANVAAPGVGGALDLDELVALDRALTKLAAVDEREARVVELRYFAGMSAEEIASFLDVSQRSVQRDWTHARAWLKRELSTGSAA